MSMTTLPVTGCECRYARPGFRCARPGGADKAQRYQLPLNLGTHTDCQARYHGGIESCKDREIVPDPIKVRPKKIERRWHFGVIYSTHYSRETPAGAHMLEHWSWTNGAQGPDVVSYYAQAIAWSGEIGEVAGLEEISDEEMARTLGARKNQRAYNCLHEFGLEAEAALAAGCDIYHSGNRWAVHSTPALIRAMEKEVA